MSIHQERDMGKLCQYYDSLTIKPYDPVYWCEHTDEKLPPIESILSLNKDVEPFVIQASALRTEFLGNDYDILQFVHLSDLHANLEAWNRMGFSVVGSYHYDTSLNGLHDTAAYTIATSPSNPLDQTLRVSLAFDFDGIKDFFSRRRR